MVSIQRLLAPPSSAVIIAAANNQPVGGSATSPNQATQDSPANSQAAAVYPPPIAVQPKAQETNPLIKIGSFIKDHWLRLLLSVLGIVGLIGLVKPFNKEIHERLNTVDNVKTFKLLVKSDKEFSYLDDNGGKISLYKSLKTLQEKSNAKELNWILYHKENDLRLDVWHPDKLNDDSSMMFYKFRKDVQKSIFGKKAPTRIAKNRNDAKVYTVNFSNID